MMMVALLAHSRKLTKKRNLLMTFTMKSLGNEPGITGDINRKCEPNKISKITHIDKTNEITVLL